MTKPTIKTVTCVGAGLIGRGWIFIFSRAGCRTRVFDNESAQLEKARDWFDNTLIQDVVDGFMTDAAAAAASKLVSFHTNLREAVSGADYIQESVPEIMEIKKATFAEIDRCADSKAIIGSSASSIDINEFTKGLAGVNRCILAHPFNPPHVIPAVEVMPTKKTDAEVTERTIKFLQSLGQKPMLMNFYSVGYLINRIQAAVVREALHLVESGLCDVEAVDTAIKDGLALRWAVLGNFGTNHTNATGGIRDYYTRYGKSVYSVIMNDLNSTPPSFDEAMIDQIGTQVDAMYPGRSVEKIARWRDKMVRKIRICKEENHTS